MAASCIPAVIPAPAPGMNAKVYAMKALSAAIKANRGVGHCREFYEDVLREFSAQD